MKVESLVEVLEDHAEHEDTLLASVEVACSGFLSPSRTDRRSGHLHMLNGAPQDFHEKIPGNQAALPELMSLLVFLPVKL